MKLPKWLRRKTLVERVDGMLQEAYMKQLDDEAAAEMAEFQVELQGRKVARLESRLAQFRAQERQVALPVLREEVPPTELDFSVADPVRPLGKVDLDPSGGWRAAVAQAV